MIPPASNSAFVAAMERVLDVYRRPYERDYPVVCMDEVSRQLIGEARVALPGRPGRPRRYDYEYVRRGVYNVFLACEALRGWRSAKVTERKTRQDWAMFIKELCDEHYPQARCITLIMDNLNTHGPASLYEAFPPEEAKRIWDRFVFVYTPKHGSWLNIAEIELSVLSGQCLSRRMEDIEKVKQQVYAWQTDRNNRNKQVDWQFTTDDARIKLKKLYPKF